MNSRYWKMNFRYRKFIFQYWKFIFQYQKFIYRYRKFNFGYRKFLWFSDIGRWISDIGNYFWISEIHFQIWEIHIFSENSDYLYGMLAIKMGFFGALVRDGEQLVQKAKFGQPKCYKCLRHKDSFGNTLNLWGVWLELIGNSQGFKEIRLNKPKNFQLSFSYDTVFPLQYAIQTVLK